LAKLGAVSAAETAMTRQATGTFFIAISFAVVRTNNWRGVTFLLALGAALGNALSLRRSINEERGLSALKSERFCN